MLRVAIGIENDLDDAGKDGSERLAGGGLGNTVGPGGEVAAFSLVLRYSVLCQK